MSFLREDIKLINDAEWASGGDPSQQLVWSHGTSDGITYHSFNLTNQQVFTEISEQAAWGNWYFSTAESDGVCVLCPFMFLEFGSKAAVTDSHNS